MSGAWHRIENPWPPDATYSPEWCGPSKSKSAALARVAFWADVSTSAKEKMCFRGGKWATPPSSGCWLYDGVVMRSSVAARVAWQLLRGPLDPADQLERTCDGPRACVRPDHRGLGAF